MYENNLPLQSITYFFRSIEPWYSVEQVITAARILNAVRFDKEFDNHFAGQYKRGEGRKDYQVICGLAAEHLVDIFADIWNSADVAIKLPRGRKKYQVIGKQ